MPEMVIGKTGRPYYTGDEWRARHGKAIKCEAHPMVRSYAKGLCKPCYDKQRRASKPELFQRSDLRKYYKKRYGITPEQALEMRAQASGGCEICGKFNGRFGRLHIDHDHVTGSVRGVLCMKCNFLIGHLEKQAERLPKILAYLERFKSPVSAILNPNRSCCVAQEEAVG